MTKKFICIKLLFFMSFNLVVTPIAYCGGKKYYRQKNCKSRIYKKDRRSLRTRKVQYSKKRKQKEKKAKEKKRKIDITSSFAKWARFQKGLLLLSYFPCFVSAKKWKRWKGGRPTITYCSHGEKILHPAFMKYQKKAAGIFWLKKCCVYDLFSKGEHGQLAPSLLYCTYSDPEFCPPNCPPRTLCPKLGGYIQNCVNGTKVCDIHYCHKCYYETEAVIYNKTLHKYQNVDYSKCATPTVSTYKFPSNSHCFVNSTASCLLVKKQLGTLKTPVIITSVLSVTILIAILMLQAQICCLFKRKRKPKEYTAEFEVETASSSGSEEAK